MKDQARRHVVEEVIDLAHAFFDDLNRKDRNLTERIADALIGHPKSPNLDPGTSGRAPIEDLSDELRGGLGYSDPTGTFAMQAATFGDRARDDQRANDKDMLSVLRLLRGIKERSEKYQPRDANVVERELTEANRPPGCESCERLPGAHGGKRYEAVSVEKAKVGDRTMRLCRWCADFLRSTGDVPTRAQVDAHHTGKRVSRNVA